MDSIHSLKRTPQDAARSEVMGGAFKRRDIVIGRKGRVANIRGENGPSDREIAKKEREVRAGFAVASATAQVMGAARERRLVTMEKV